MYFVPIKTIGQQGKLVIHRAHQGYVAQRTALINRIQGILSELGIVLPLAYKAFYKGYISRWKNCLVIVTRLSLR